MASKGIVLRDLRRRELNAKFAARRAELKEQLRHSWDNPQEVMRLQGELMKLPLNSSPTRLHNRDYITGLLLPFGVPIEELLFFLVIPLCALLTYNAVTAILDRARRR